MIPQARDSGHLWYQESCTRMGGSSPLPAQSKYHLATAHRTFVSICIVSAVCLSVFLFVLSCVCSFVLFVCLFVL